MATIPGREVFIIRMGLIPIMADDPVPYPPCAPLLSRTIDGPEVVDAFARFLVDLSVTSIRAEKCSLLLPAPKGEELFILCARGIAPEVVGRRRFRFGQGICGEVARSLRPLFVPEIDKDPHYRRRQRYEYASPSFMVCPIVHQGDLLGLLTLSGRHDGHPFAPRDFQFGLEIAERAAHPLKSLQTRELAEPSGNQSDDWRNRLHAIHGAVYYLRQGRNLSPERREEFLELIAAETGRLIAMADGG